MEIKLKPPSEDQIAYLKAIEASAYNPVEPCQRCGAPWGEHIIGGPGPYHPNPPVR